MSKQKVTFWLLCCTVLCFSVQRLEMQFRECFGYSREEFEEILAKHNREKEAEFMEGDVFGGLLMETVSAPLIAIEGIQNQWRARTGRKTDYSFLEGREQTRSEVTAGMGSIGTVVYQGAADITSQLTLAMLTFGRDKAMAGAMGSMYMDTMQHRKEREGVDELKAADTALLTGMADYYLGNLGYRHISRCVEEGVRKSLVRKMGESFLTGAGMALGSETGGQLIDWMLNGRLSEWGKIYNAHLDEGMSETEAFGEMVKDVGPELTVHTVAGGISGAGFAVIHMLAASKDDRLRKQETIEKTNQGGERNRNETSYGKSIENTEFFKENGGLDASDYISIHSRKHMYDPDTVSTPKKTQYGKDVNVGKLCEDTIMKPDEVIYNKDQNVMIYKKEYPFNISTSDTPTGTHRVFIPLNTQGKKTIRMSQFPLVGGN
mgnify:CR=1 FL=1